MDKKIASIVKALAYTENGGQPNIKKPNAGKTGEMKSIFQFTPDTWKLYAKQISGDENLPMTAENEAQVVYHKVNDWLNKGYKPEQIASMWNAGEQRPDAYKQNFKGVNKKYNVAYDTPAYVKKFSNYIKQFEGEAGGETKSPSKQEGPNVAKPNTNPGMIQPPPQAQPPQTGMMPPAMKQVKQIS